MFLESTLPYHYCQTIRKNINYAILSLELSMYLFYPSHHSQYQSSDRNFLLINESGDGCRLWHDSRIEAVVGNGQDGDHRSD